MADRNRAALRTASRRVLMASFLVLGLVVTAASFAIGFAGSLQQGLNDPQSAPRLRQDALARLDESLGYGGYLKAYRIFAGAADGAAGNELLRLSNTADRSLGLLLSASTSDEERAAAERLRRLAAPFRRIALFASATKASLGALPAESALERDYALLKAEISRAADAAAFDRMRALSDALVWAQVTSVTALSLLAMVLFALALFLRERLIGPLAKLRRSVVSAVQGALDEPIWGIERKDEIGALARAADKLRDAVSENAKRAPPPPLAKMMERLANAAIRLEADLAKMTAVTSHARTRIEDASKGAAVASKTAMEVAGLAREGAARLGARANETVQSANNEVRAVVDALAGTLTRLSETAAKFDALKSGAFVNPAPVDTRLDAGPFESGALAGIGPTTPDDDDVGHVLEGLAGDLDALENFTRGRQTLAQHEGVALSAALVEAIDRLNHVAGRISAATGRDLRDVRKIA